MSMCEWEWPEGNRGLLGYHFLMFLFFFQTHLYFVQEHCLKRWVCMPAVPATLSFSLTPGSLLLSTPYAASRGYLLSFLGTSCGMTARVSVSQWKEIKISVQYFQKVISETACWIKFLLHHGVRLKFSPIINRDLGYKHLFRIKLYHSNLIFHNSRIGSIIRSNRIGI